MNYYGTIARSISKVFHVSLKVISPQKSMMSWIAIWTRHQLNNCNTSSGSAADEHSEKSYVKTGPIRPHPSF